MAFGDGLKDKIIKLGGKGKIDSILKYTGNPSEDVRVAVAMALGMIPTYDSGTALIGSFISTVKLWIGNGLTQSPGEIIDSYLKCLIRQHKNG